MTRACVQHFVTGEISPRDVRRTIFRFIALRQERRLRCDDAMVRFTFVIVQVATVSPQVGLCLFAGSLKDRKDR
jgi:hypothetical protein